MSRNRPPSQLQRNRSHSQHIQSASKDALVYTEQHLWQAPIPPAEELSKYSNIIPNGAERIFNQFEAQSEHRRGLETKVIDNDIRNSKLGMLLGFVLQLVAIVGAVVLSITRSMWEGIVGAIAVIIVGYLNFRATLRKRELDIEERKLLQNKPTRPV